MTEGQEQTPNESLGGLFGNPTGRADAPEPGAGAPKETPAAEPKETKPKDATEEAPEKDEKEGEKEDGEEAADAEGDGEDKEEKPPEPVPYEEHAKIVAEREEAVQLITDLESQVEGLQEKANKFDAVDRFFSDLAALAQFDPLVRQLFEKDERGAYRHWFLAGRKPTAEEVEDPMAYASFEIERGKRSDQSAQVDPEAEREVSGALKDIKETWNAEEAKLTKEYGDVYDDDAARRSYLLLSSVLEKTGGAGDANIHSLETAFKYLFSKQIAEKERQKGREEATARSKRPATGAVRPGTATQAPAKAFEKMGRLEQVKHLTETGGEGTSAEASW